MLLRTTYEEPVDILFEELAGGASLLLLIIVAISILQIAVLFAQLKLYSIDKTLKKQQQILDTMDTHIYEMKTRELEQIKILNDINTNLIKILNKGNS